MPSAPRRNWTHPQPWILINQDDLAIERRQLVDEGKDPVSFDEEFSFLAVLDLNEEANQQCAEALLDAIQQAPQHGDYPYHEPSDLAGIQAERPAPMSLPDCTLSDADLREKALGAWLGRASGCLLGKPVEGKRSWDIKRYLETQGRWPLDRYFSSKIPAEIACECNISSELAGLFEEGITCMVEDDDTNYTVTGLAIVKEFGADFTPENVGQFWLNNIPYFHLCTAERVAYRNMVQCILPPYSASLRNPYREWIGAQIRADFFGYVNPGNPERAADFAWRDASISHIKNGIYGEMWVAAMLAAAYVCDDLPTIIRAGLAQIPATCRLTEAIERILAQYADGMSYDEAIADLRTRWDETQSHDWCHTISNAELVAIALLWGEKDFTKTLGYAVMPGFDTDCNGATAGSVLGLVLGAEGIPEYWTKPLHDTLRTGIAGYNSVSLTQMADETVALIRSCAGAGL